MNKIIFDAKNLDKVCSALKDDDTFLQNNSNQKLFFSYGWIFQCQLPEKQDNGIFIIRNPTKQSYLNFKEKMWCDT